MCGLQRLPALRPGLWGRGRPTLRGDFSPREALCRGNAPTQFPYMLRSLSHQSVDSIASSVDSSRLPSTTRIVSEDLDAFRIEGFLEKHKWPMGFKGHYVRIIPGESNYMLAFYKNEKIEVPRESIPLDVSTLVEVDSDNADYFPFFIKAGGSRHCLRTHSGEERSHWIVAIKEAAAEAVALTIGFLGAERQLMPVKLEEKYEKSLMKSSMESGTGSEFKSTCTCSESSELAWSDLSPESESSAVSTANSSRAHGGSHGPSMELRLPPPPSYLCLISAHASVRHHLCPPTPLPANGQPSWSERLSPQLMAFLFVSATRAHLGSPAHL